MEEREEQEYERDLSTQEAEEERKRRTIVQQLIDDDKTKMEQATQRLEKWSR